MSRPDPAQRLTELGIAPRDAKGLVRALRRDVARLSDSLLPDVAYSAAPGPFLGGQRVLAEVVTGTVRDMMRIREDIPATPGMARFAALPVIALDPVTDEWIRHASRRRLGIMIATRPEPDPALRGYRDSHKGTAATFADRVSSVLYQAIATRFPDQRARDAAVEWTGWALLAVMQALATHEHQVPFPDWRGPDRDALYATDAFHKGQELLTGAALNLIDEAGREAA